MSGLRQLGVLGGTDAELRSLTFELEAAAAGSGLALTPSADGADALVVIDAPVAVIAGSVAAGRPVLCLPSRGAEAGDIAALPADAGLGFALCPSAIRHTPGGERIAQAADSGRLGTVLSAYLSLRAGPGPEQPSLRTLAWEAMDLIATVTSAPLARAHAVATANLLTAILRFADDTVVTVDLSRELPGPTAPESAVEAEAEVVGTQGLLRAEPYQTAVRVLGADGAASFLFTPSAVRGMLAEFLVTLTDTAALAARRSHMARVLGLTKAIESASASGLGSWHRFELCRTASGPASSKAASPKPS